MAAFTGVVVPVSDGAARAQAYTWQANGPTPLIDYPAEEAAIGSLTRDAIADSSNSFTGAVPRNFNDVIANKVLLGWGYAMTGTRRREPQLQDVGFIASQVIVATCIWNNSTEEATVLSVDAVDESGTPMTATGVDYYPVDLEATAIPAMHFLGINTEYYNSGPTGYTIELSGPTALDQRFAYVFDFPTLPNSNGLQRLTGSRSATLCAIPRPLGYAEGRYWATDIFISDTDREWRESHLETRPIRYVDYPMDLVSMAEMQTALSTIQLGSIYPIQVPLWFSRATLADAAIDTETITLAEDPADREFAVDGLVAIINALDARDFIVRTIDSISGNDLVLTTPVTEFAAGDWVVPLMSAVPDDNARVGYTRGANGAADIRFTEI